MRKIKKIIKLSAVWCAPCKAYATVFEEVSKKEENKDIKFESYDVEDDDEGNELADKYHVRNIPTSLFFDENNELIYKLSGSFNSNILQDLINKHN